MISEMLIFLSSIIGITWSMVFVMATFIGCSVYKVTGQKFQSFCKEIKYASIWNNDEPEGWVFGKWYLGYIYKSSSMRGDTTLELFVFTTKKFYNCNINITDDESENTIRKTKVTFYERDGNGFWNLFYIPRQISIPELEPYEKQTIIINAILKDFIERTYSIVLITGKAGTGKSIIPYFVARDLLNSKLFTNIKKVSMVDTFNPTQPGDKFNTIYIKSSPKKDKPLIVILEEADILLSNIHSNSIEIHRDIPIQITNKIQWNMFFDRFDRQLYPHVIFIMTSNKSISYFEELDSSYMRTGRVNCKFEL
jgi:hypothetical protein